MKDSNEHSFQELLNHFKHNPRYKAQLFRKKIESVWGDMMGNWISNETESIQISNQRLILKISSAPLRQELHFSRDKIRDRVNEALQEAYITEVIVR